MSVSVADYVHNLHKSQSLAHPAQPAMLLHDRQSLTRIQTLIDPTNSQMLTGRAAHYMGGKPMYDRSTDAAAASVNGGLEHVTVIASVRATSGLVTGRIKLNAWATNQKERIDSMAGISILKNCVLCLLNGALGQRGLLMQRIQIHNIAIRCTGMTVDFSVWLPSVKSSTDEADAFYAGCVKEALARLSTEEVRQYFPLFIFQGQDDEKHAEPDSMISLPMSAPAAVPDEEGEGEVVAPTDTCEMMLCTTKQKKRKGVPYCGTCRKFMEETVKWYCDTYQRHPAKEKNLFVPAVRNERYQCKHPNTPSCDCKACHSLRRFEEMYPKCEAKLDEFKRRTFMFEDREKRVDKPSRNASSAANGDSARAAQKQGRGQRLANRQSTEKSGRSRRGEYSDDDGRDAAPAASAPGPPTLEYDPRFQSSLKAGLPKTPTPAFASTSSDVYGRDAVGFNPESSPRSRKRKNSLNMLPLPPVAKSRYNQQQYDEVMSSLLPSYIFNIDQPSVPSSPTKDPMSRSIAPMSPSGLDPETLSLETDSLYKELCLEDPLAFSTLESMATTAPLNTWLCSVCASWNHPSRGSCSRCKNRRT